ncbi:hypothetical protein [Gordonia sp. ABSL49_1]|uniref:FitA-like ribbon-helix-helix domain-containing protein n=1 Tax=Gordonia sp. ABSL49_1 TaxID=2920941 RepID=UPI001F0F4D08|nr:hypothetical protein [Gordonia sp. ABSL49_1]MCH5641914.1 hypothetical protein [Gordonia sp. ABSL49_1]
MPVSITIRHVPNHTRDVLADRAARSGRSLQEYLVAELERLAAQPTLEDWLVDARASASANPATTVDDILEDLDTDRS